MRDLVIHCFTDGRDTLPESGVEHVGLVERWCLELGRPGRSAKSVWPRSSGAGTRWTATAAGSASRRPTTCSSTVAPPTTTRPAWRPCSHAYDRGETDEFIDPTTVGDEGLIRPCDSVFCFNFRPDRMREITRALAEPGFGESDEDLPGWEGRGGIEPVEQYTTLTEYEEDWTYPVAFPPERPAVTLAGVLADAGAPQLHVAETEKYAHVTYFFNGGEEVPHAGRAPQLVPSPREVPTYDLKPEMSARTVTDAFVAAWREQRSARRFAIINFANADMVGHTGVIPAAVRAIETVDECLGEVVRAVHDAGGACLVTADHGNAEQMLEPDGSPNTAHTSNPVPLVVTLPAVALLQGEGILADVAPTVLAAARHPPAGGDDRALADPRIPHHAPRLSAPLLLCSTE